MHKLIAVRFQTRTEGVQSRETVGGGDTAPQAKEEGP